MIKEFAVHQMVPISIFETVVPIKPEWISYAETTDYERVQADNGFMTKSKYVLNDLPDCKKMIHEQFDAFMRQYFTVKKNINFGFQNSWINKHEYLDSTHDHSHVNSLFSGVLYLKTDNQSGDISFKVPPYDNPVTKGFQLEFEEWNMHNSCDYSITPKVGSLLIFPSYLVHGVSENKSPFQRYSLAFNLHFKDAEWGKDEGVVKMNA